MSILNLIPELAIHLLLGVSMIGTIAGFLLNFIPFIGKYKLPIQVISVVLLSMALWLEGGLSNEKKWLLEVKEMEAKVAEAEAKAAKVNVQIVEKVVKEIEYIRIKGDKVVEYIDREVKVYDNQCKIPEVVIDIHNMSATNTAPKEEKK
jgi:hypothetical protein